MRNELQAKKYDDTNTYTQSAKQKVTENII
jgi:hypothetical protein